MHKVILLTILLALNVKFLEDAVPAKLMKAPVGLFFV
jgi:hypothetical protein